MDSVVTSWAQTACIIICLGFLPWLRKCIFGVPATDRVIVVVVRIASRKGDESKEE